MTTATYEIGRRDAYHTVLLDGRQIAQCKTREAAERVIADRETCLSANRAEAIANAARSLAAEQEADRLYESILPRVRKVISREPGYAVASLGDRCESVATWWDLLSGPRAVIVVMAEGADLSGTQPLTEDDRESLRLRIERGV